MSVEQPALSASRRQKYSIKALDVCESYFLGKRAVRKKDEEPIWLKTLRMSSMATGIIPLIFAGTFLIARSLIRPDKKMRGFWETHIIEVCEQKEDYGLNKERFIDLLIRSGIYKTDFDYIYITTFSTPEMLGFSADGQMANGANRSHEERIRTLALDICVKNKLDKKYRYKINAYDAPGVEPTSTYPATERLMGATDANLSRYFKKISNQLKTILVEGPEFKEDCPKTFDAWLKQTNREGDSDDEA